MSARKILLKSYNGTRSAIHELYFEKMAALRRRGSGGAEQRKGPQQSAGRTAIPPHRSGFPGLHCRMLSTDKDSTFAYAIMHNDRACLVDFKQLTDRTAGYIRAEWEKEIYPLFCVEQSNIGKRCEPINKS